MQVTIGPFSTFPLMICEVWVNPSSGPSGFFVQAADIAAATASTLINFAIEYSISKKVKYIISQIYHFVKQSSRVLITHPRLGES